MCITAFDIGCSCGWWCEANVAHAAQLYRDDVIPWAQGMAIRNLHGSTVQCRCCKGGGVDVSLVNSSPACTTDIILTRFARRRRSIVAGFLALGLLAALGANIAITSVLTMASSKNYPGGYALASLNHRFSHLPSGKFLRCPLMFLFLIAVSCLN